MLLQALSDHCGNLTLAAQAVGYTREVFESVLRQHGIGEVM
jgi:transcriptional regulator of acetoin/glycerol metabolism